MTQVFSKIDDMGLYVRLGDEPIVSYSAYGWGGVYYTGASVIPMSPLMKDGKKAVAFDVIPGESIPWNYLEQQTGIGRALVDLVSPELIRLGWGS